MQKRYDIKARPKYQAVALCSNMMVYTRNANAEDVSTDVGGEIAFLVILILVIICVYSYQRIVEKNEYKKKKREQQEAASICDIEGHDLVGCVCQRCKAEIHEWGGCICTRCGSGSHSWEVIGREVTGGYSSPFAEEGYVTYGCKHCSSTKTEEYRI